MGQEGISSIQNCQPLEMCLGLGSSTRRIRSAQSTEDNERNLYPVKELIRDMAKGVNAMCMKANAEFVPPVVIDRIEREWKMA